MDKGHYSSFTASAARSAAEAWLADPSKSPGLQKSIPASVTKALCPFPLWHYFDKRLLRSFPDMMGAGLSSIPTSRWAALAKSLGSCSTSWAPAYLKTPTNGWTTSHRVLGDRD
eukprot:1281209-Pyramimonas_sp.AAC.1